MSTDFNVVSIWLYFFLLDERRQSWRVVNFNGPGAGFMKPPLFFPSLK